MYSPPKKHISIHSRRRAVSGFTLIELLMVVAVIMVLVGITFGISRGVKNAQARTQVRADLAVLGQALEDFKSVHGSYPFTDKIGADSENNQRMVDALRGRMVFTTSRGKLEGVKTTMKNRDGYSEFGNSESGGRVFIEEASMSLLEDDGADGQEFLDPWGRDYLYDYTAGKDTWENFGFILYSSGADGAYQAVDEDGILTTDIREHEDNLDNIYFGD